MIYIIKGRKRKGKTTVAVGLLLEFILKKGYDLADVYSTTRLYKMNGEELQTYHYCTIEQMREVVKQMVVIGRRRVIFLIDEIDRIFSHRFWSRKEQAEALLGVWQDEKLECHIIGTSHVGKGIDLLLRESMNYEIFCDIRKKLNIIRLQIIDVNDRRVFPGTMINVNLVQKLFDTRQPVA